MPWGGASWNQAQPFPVSQTEYAKVTPVKGEHHVNPFTDCQVYQRCIGKLHPQAFILGEDRGKGRTPTFAQLPVSGWPGRFQEWMVDMGFLPRA
jgi:hypothetical protein